LTLHDMSPGLRKVVGRESPRATLAEEPDAGNPLVRIWRGAELGNRSAYSTTAFLALPRPHLPSAPRPPAGAAYTKAARDGPRLGLVLARQCRMGEGSAAGVPWGDGGLGKPMANGKAHVQPWAPPRHGAHGAHETTRGARNPVPHNPGNPPPLPDAR
jgi:hypothetical protein